jgi:hypothetical protein
MGASPSPLKGERAGVRGHYQNKEAASTSAYFSIKAHYSINNQPLNPIFGVAATFLWKKVYALGLY